MAMRKKKDILDKAVNALKNERLPHGPPKELTDAVATKLSQAGGQPGAASGRERTKTISLTKVAAAATLLVVAGYAIVAGYAVGRLTAPRPPDMEQLHAALETSLKSSIEPAVRQNLLEELKKYWQIALAGSYVQLKDELGQQFRSEMNEFGTQVLAASGAVTNQRLTELIEAINTAQTHERRWIAEAIDQIERSRLLETTELRNDLATFAVRAEDEFRRTREDMTRFLVYTRPDSLAPDQSQYPQNSKERSKK
jgi:hypothetical protein